MQSHAVCMAKKCIIALHVFYKKFLKIYSMKRVSRLKFQDRKHFLLHLFFKVKNSAKNPPTACALVNVLIIINLVKAFCCNTKAAVNMHVFRCGLKVRAPNG